MSELMDGAGLSAPNSWRDAALRIGEEFGKTGPEQYYSMTPEQWTVWALCKLRAGAAAGAVPREPTVVMVNEGLNVLRVTGGNPWEDTRAMWQAMHDAAPSRHDQSGGQK